MYVRSGQTRQGARILASGLPDKYSLRKKRNTRPFIVGKDHERGRLYAQAHNTICP